MDRSKKLMGLLGGLAVVCVAAFAVTKYEEHKENIKNSDTVILELDTEGVTALSWKNSTAELSFHKDEKWLYDDDEAFPVDEDKVKDLLNMFQEFEASFIVEDVEDYSQYGLDEPVCTILITSDGQTDDAGKETPEPLEITLGDFSKMDSQRYVSIGDGNVYLVKDDPLVSFDVELSDMVKNDEVPEFDQADNITFTGEIAYQINYVEESGKSYQEKDVYYVKDGSDALPLDTSLVDSYLSAISGTRLTEYVTYDVTDEELSSYGLNSPDLSITVEYTYKNDNEDEVSDAFVMHISRDPEEKAAAEGIDDEEEEEESVTAYVRIGDSQIVYKLDSGKYKTLMKAAYNDLRHQNIYYGDFDDVNQIDISLEGNDYSITSEKKGDEKIYYYGEEELDLADLQSRIKGLTAVEFTETAVDGKEEIRIKLQTENENFPTMEIVLYRYDGEQCLAEVNGTPVAFVERKDVVDLIEAVNSIIL